MTSLLRLCSLIRVFSRYRLIELLPKQRGTKFLSALLWLFGFGSKRCSNETPRGERIRLALQDLGPVYIKLGQIVSTRRDMLPDDIADELAKLQDQVAPFCSEQAQQIIEQELQRPIADCFASFESEPLASASVAQVHACTLHDGSDAVVKVLRPDIERAINSDILLLRRLSWVIESLVDDAKRVRLPEIIHDYDQVIHAELDLKQEAANGALLRRNFSSESLNEMMVVPEVYWDYSTERVLVMERMYGIPVTNVEELQQKHTDLHLLAVRGVDIFFTQVFEQNFFHADMHPGNILIDVSNPENPRYITLDCAIMGTLSDTDRYYTARILLSALNRDYAAVAKLHRDSGWLRPDVPLAAFESVIRSVCEPIFSKPIAEIGFGSLLVYLFKAARRFGMEVQPSLVLLQKTLVNIEGLGQQLYPELDLWETAQPFLDRWVNEHYSAAGASKLLQAKLPELAESLPVLPQQFKFHLRELLVDVGVTPSSELKEQVATLQKTVKRQQYFGGLLALIALAWAAHYWLS